MSSAADDSSAYPVLGDEEVAILRRYGTVHRTTAGQVLSAADDTYDLIVVLSGCVEVGFPEGISGTELTTRATIQAQKFGALLASPCRVDRLTVSGGKFSVLLTDGTVLSARTVVAATGPSIAACRWRAGGGWKEREFTTPPRTWRPGCAPARRSSSWAAGTRPARLRSTWPGDAPGSRSSAGTTRSRHRCRST